MEAGIEEAEAVRRVQAGDIEAFRHLLKRYQGPLRGFIQAMVRTPAQVEDIGQEAFLRAFQSIRRFDPARGAAFGTWLFAIARNVCIDHLRGRGREEPLGDEVETFAEADAGLPAETLRALDRALAGLPEEQRLAVEWVFVQGFSYEESARLEGISVGTLASRLARAKDKLKTCLSGGAPLGGRRNHGPSGR